MSTRTSRRPIDVRVFPAFRATIKPPWLRAVAREALAAADPTGLAGASVVVADDDTLRDLNARFRGLDEVTDVLSFGGDARFPEVPGAEVSLGEVVLSYPSAVLQASQHDVTVERELALLTVHGILHLLGHDHADPFEEAEMKALEEQALGRLFRSAPSPAGGAR